MSVLLSGSLGSLFLVWSVTHCIALTDFFSNWGKSVLLRCLISVVVGALYGFTLQQWCSTLLWLLASALLDVIFLPNENIRSAGSYYLGNALLLITFLACGEFAVPGRIPVLNTPEVVKTVWSAGLVLFAVQPGNHLVRSVLRSCGSPLPGQAPEKPGLIHRLRAPGAVESAAAEDTALAEEIRTPPVVGREQSRADSSGLLSSAQEDPRLGQVIGALERLLIITLVVTNSYEALGFIIGAKGFVRYRKLADERFAEYFLVGTMTSTLVGVLLGLGVKAFW
ncbi:MAG TPA: hypothetical protein GXZ82_11680 [Firmicutes bacterium]|nr:hypothetical protein [Bacillota bacterium]